MSQVRQAMEWFDNTAWAQDLTVAMALFALAWMLASQEKGRGE